MRERTSLPNRSLPSAAMALAFVIAVPPSVGGQVTSDMDAATLYARACAACHGANGAGLAPDHPAYANFDPPPADLTDPLFNSREPGADWALVIKYGGQRLGLSQQMPAFEGALSDEQIDQVVAHLKTLADTERYPPGDLNFLRAIATIKAFPEDEALIINRYADGDGAPNSFRTTLYWARRLGARYQTEIKLAHLNRGGDAELEEAELGFKWAVRDDLEKMSLWTVGVEAALPIEDDSASNELIPYLSFAKGLSDALTLQGTLKAKVPVPDDAEDGEAQLSAIIHWMRSPWPRAVFPALEATLTSPFSDGDSEATLIPQLYFGLSKGGHVALALGVEIPLTDLDYEYRLHSFLLWDIADGPFWVGW